MGSPGVVWERTYLRVKLDVTVSTWMRPVDTVINLNCKEIKFKKIKKKSYGDWAHSVAG